MQPGEAFSFSNYKSEMALMDCYTTEHIDIFGTDIWYYSLNLATSVRDPLYDEPVERKYVPYKVKGFVTLPDGPKELTQEGFSSSWDAVAYISRKSIEAAGAPPPGEADILRFWDTPFFNKDGSVNGFPIPDAGFYFSVVAGGEDGFRFDNPDFTVFTATLRRVSKFTPERKLRNQI